jgi:hypothetical protein
MLWAPSGNGRGLCGPPTRSAIQKRRIRCVIRRWPDQGIKRFEAETALVLVPPLRSAWGGRGRPLEVPSAGFNARRVIFATSNSDTGPRLVWARERPRGEDIRAFLPVSRRQYRGWPVALLWDEDPSHTAEAARDLATALGIRLIWSAQRSPERNGMDHLWGQGKDHVGANRQYPGIAEAVNRFVGSLQGLSNREALRQAGILSEEFWLSV